jgi:hypothetical protein
LAYNLFYLHRDYLGSILAITDTAERQEKVRCPFLAKERARAMAPANRTPLANCVGPSFFSFSALKAFCEDSQQKLKAGIAFTDVP